MVRDDLSLNAAADPPTVKTEPPKDDAREPEPPAGGAEGAGPGRPADSASDPRGEDDEIAAAPHVQEPVHSEPEFPALELPPPQSDQDAHIVSLDAPTEPVVTVVPEAAPPPSTMAAGIEAGGSMHAPAAIAATAADAGPAADHGSTRTPRSPRPLLADWDRARIKSVGVRAAKVAAIVFTAWFTVVIFLIAVYRFVNPPFSSLMVTQWITGTSIQREWAPIERISPNLVRAVVASEDGRFCGHWGIDFGEVAAALQRTVRGTPRGASTITMQVAKNLFLLPAKSYVRKVIEVPLTYAIEIMWSKRRIMEVYLNIAEWGPGVFGAEAAAREHFKRSAARLSARQAAQLAVALPNPFVRDAGDPGPWASRRASVIQRRAARSPGAADCVLKDD